MTTKEAISAAFSNLSQFDTLVYDYWVGVMYTQDGEIKEDQWNEKNLKFMEDDVMQLSNI